MSKHDRLKDQQDEVCDKYAVQDRDCLQIAIAVIQAGYPQTTYLVNLLRACAEIIEFGLQVARDPDSLQDQHDRQAMHAKVQQMIEDGEIDAPEEWQMLPMTKH